MSKILVIGSANTDFISKMKEFPVPGETVEGSLFLQAMGGKGANQALAAHKLGADVRFVTCLGKDINGENTINYYKNQNLDISLVVTVENVPSGTAMIWVDQMGENCIVVTPGANKILSPEHIDKMEDVIAKADMVVVQMEISYNTIKKTCEIANRNHTKLLLNAAPAHPIDPETMNRIDILVVNETEAEIISGKKIELIGIEAVVDELRSMGPTTVILTLGKNGSFLKNEKTVIKVPAYEVKTVDSTAAGDVFCGALAASLVKGHNWDEALKFATAASAICVNRMGAQPSIPSKNEVNIFLKNINNNS